MSYQAIPDIQPESKFDRLVKLHELKPPIPQQLRDVLTKCKVVLLCDDSHSMNLFVTEEGANAFTPKKTTRWTELMKLASVVIEFVTAVNDNGLDIHFLNRKSVYNVVDMTGLQQVFSKGPSGSTPLIGSLQRIHNEYKYNLGEKQLLIVVVTDGEPTDGNRDNLYWTLSNITAGGNVHISFAECTDNEEDMEYLDAWDGRIRNFDNTDDYREELRRVKQTKGQSFKFTYEDYVIKILLATFIPYYYNLDQGARLSGISNPDDCCCCNIV